MDIFEIFDKAKTAKQRGKKYEYPGTPVKFEFRCLTSSEGRAIRKLAEAAQASEDADSIVAELIKINPLVGWEGMTKGMLEDISSLQLGVPENERDEQIPYSEEYSQRMLATCVGYDGKEIRNVPFLSFMSDSIKDAAEKASIAANAQKKI